MDRTFLDRSVHQRRSSSDRFELPFWVNIASNLHFHSVRSAVMIASVMVCLMSALGSNTATASLVIPILAAMAARWGMDPQSILWPATLAASLGFMLPVASPMQTIVFGTGRIPMQQMVKAGVWMDLIGVALLMLFFGWG